MTKEKGAEMFESGFDRFWRMWPVSTRKGGKSQCMKIWEKNYLESCCDSIIKHVEWMKTTDQWRKANGAFIPAPSVYLNQQAYCAPDKMTGFSRLSQYGMTYKPLTEDLGEELLMLYLAGFHAKTSVPQEKAQELTENEAECGEKWHGLLARYNPNSHSWKTVQCSLLEDSIESLQTLPRWGMTVGGVLWGLTPWVRPTKETECGLSEKFPTPNAWDGRRGPLSKELYDKKTKQISLVTHIRHSALTLQNGGQLNPDWVEWLMGWMPGWTDLKPLETDKSLCVQQQHGVY